MLLELAIEIALVMEAGLCCDFANTEMSFTEEAQRLRQTQLRKVVHERTAGGLLEQFHELRFAHVAKRSHVGDRDLLGIVVTEPFLGPVKALDKATLFLHDGLRLLTEAEVQR